MRLITAFSGVLLVTVMGADLSDFPKRLKVSEAHYSNDSSLPAWDDNPDINGTYSLHASQCSTDQGLVPQWAARMMADRHRFKMFQWSTSFDKALQFTPDYPCYQHDKNENIIICSLSHGDRDGRWYIVSPFYRKGDEAFRVHCLVVRGGNLTDRWQAAEGTPPVVVGPCAICEGSGVCTLNDPKHKPRTDAVLEALHPESLDPESPLDFRFIASAITSSLGCISCGGTGWADTPKAFDFSVVPDAPPAKMPENTFHFSLAPPAKTPAKNLMFNNFSLEAPPANTPDTKMFNNFSLGAPLTKTPTANDAQLPQRRPTRMRSPPSAPQPPRPLEKNTCPAQPSRPPRPWAAPPRRRPTPSKSRSTSRFPTASPPRHWARIAAQPPPPHLGENA